MSRKVKIIENVTLTGIADRGKAVGRDEQGIVYFVSDAVPGDVVNIVRGKKKRGVYQGKIKDFVTLSPDRIEPKCQHFSLCGGCKWQNLDYSTQLKHKTQTVIDAMSRIAKVDTSTIAPIKGAEKIYEYRNKIEYSFSEKRWLTRAEIDSKEKLNQSPAVGFHHAGAFDKVVDIMQCHLQEDTTNRIRNFIRDYALQRDWTFYNAVRHTGLFRNMFLRNTLAGKWMMTLVFGKNDTEKREEILNQILEKFPEISSMFYIINTKKNDSIFDLEPVHYAGDTFLEESLGEIKYKISPKSFFQTNTYQAKVLFDTIEDFADLTGTENVYDLYTGIGSIGLFLAKNAKQIVGIEEVEDAINDAKVNAELNNIDNAVFYVGDVKDMLSSQFSDNHGAPDIIITDPPRAGMHKDIVETLLQLESPRIIYISCNPATQARDLALLKEKYEIIKMQPVDMFPHTHHIENVALLKLRS